MNTAHKHISKYFLTEMHGFMTCLPIAHTCFSAAAIHCVIFKKGLG